MTENEAIDCLMADKEYLQDMNVCDGEEMDVAIKALEEVQQYRDLEEQGLLLRLPCERVWDVCDAGTEYATVMSKSIDDLGIYQIKEIDVKGYYFSTKAEAEEKLRELKGK